MADITSNLVAHWKLDETSGTSAADSSGNGYTGTYSRAASNTTGVGVIATCYVPTAAASDYITTGSTSLGSTDLFCDTDTFTVAVWTKAATATNGIIVAKASGTAANRTFSLFFTGGTLALILRGTQTNFASKTCDGTWHHVAVTWGGSGSATVYWDGVSAGTATPGAAVIEAENIMIAARTSGSPAFFMNPSGTLDDVRIYSRALSADDVAALYAWRGGKVITPGGMQGGLQNLVGGING